MIGEEGEECTIEKGGRILGDDCSSVDYVLEVSDARSVKFFKLHRFNLLIQGGLALYLLNQPCFALILNFSSLLRHIFLRIIMFLEENFLCKSNIRATVPSNTRHSEDRWNAGVYVIFQQKSINN